MNRVEQKKISRRILSEKNRKNRFISGYIQVKHSNIYDEAKAYYNQLKLKYPEKKDLTKTVEYLTETTAFQSYPQMYYARKLQNQKQNKKINVVKKQNKKINFTDSMELKIPLINNMVENQTQQQEVPLINNMPENQTQQQEAYILDDKVYEELLQDLKNDPDLYSIFNDMDVYDLSHEPQLEITVLDHQEQQVTSSTDTLEEIVHELSKDPYMYDTINNIDDQTPLERELIAMGY